jgi:hypothetical protein
VPDGYREESIERLCEVLSERGRAIDASDTGAGRMYMAAFVCMKRALGAWKRALVAVRYGEGKIFVNNYEQYLGATASGWTVARGSGVMRKTKQWTKCTDAGTSISFHDRRGERPRYS